MIINAHTITSPNTKIPAAPTTEMISVVTTINISNMINKIMNKHIYISSFFSLKWMHITRINMPPPIKTSLPITASPLSFTCYNVHESYTGWSQI